MHGTKCYEGAGVRCACEKTLDKISVFLIQACVGVYPAHTPNHVLCLERNALLVRHYCGINVGWMNCWNINFLLYLIVSYIIVLMG